VTTREHRNWTGGEWRPAQAAAGSWFEHASERWPRSGPADVERALASLETRGEWQRCGSGERLAALARAQARLGAREDLAPRCVESFGLSPDEARSFLDTDRFQFAQGLELLRDGPLAREHPDRGDARGVFLAHWSDLAGRLASRLAAQLSWGRSALLLGDPRLPWAAEAVVEAFVEAGVHAGALALVWDDTRASIAAALGSRDVHWWRAAGAPELLRDLAARARPELLERAELWPLRTRAERVLSDDDPAMAAVRIVELAFGRAATLSGQLPGHVGQLVCHQRQFSRFAEALLAELGANPDVQRPLPLFEEGADDLLQEAWALGLDEGATPIFGPERGLRSRSRSSRVAEPLGQEAPGDWGGLAHATVFTNVEPHQRLARLAPPLPLLCLIRARSDAQAAELVQDLDASGRILRPIRSTAAPDSGVGPGVGPGIGPEVAQA
jgi:acyl-CoA reductase-like NAD-dependent aldehyde dehydrogenase